MVDKAKSDLTSDAGLPGLIPSTACNFHCIKFVYIMFITPIPTTRFIQWKINLVIFFLICH